ncbi:MAG TPA: hypothetical protein VFH95_09725 [Candidatus Kapabacteria bacterium]|nr:hypothetical protein [Candidatus Kapabacteria bacterium]
MRLRHRTGLGFLRRGFSVHVLSALLFLAITARTGSDFFHTEGPENAGATISAPCTACELEATTALGAPDPPVLPPLTVLQVEAIVLPEAYPFAPVILHARGRAPPSL